MNETTRVRVNDVTELVAGVPRLLGFKPADGDLVLVCLRGGRVGLTARVTLGKLDAWEGAVAALAAAYRQDEAETALVVLYGHTPERLLLINTLLDGQRVDVREAARVVGDRVHCASGCSHDLPADTVLDAAMVGMGQVVQTSRDALLDRIRWSGKDATPYPGGADQQALAHWHWELRDIPSRDRQLGLLADATYERLGVNLDQLCMTARYTRPGELRDAVLSVAAATAHVMGDGAMARVCLDEVGPWYSLARLLTMALDQMVNPSVLRGILRQAAALQ